MRGVVLLLGSVLLHAPGCDCGVVLGEHAHAVEGPAEFLDGDLTPQRFYDEHVRAMSPVVIRGGVSRDDGFHKWTDEYLVTNYGNLTVKIEKKNEQDGLDGMKSRAPLAEYFQEMQQRAYVVSQLPTPMAHEASVLSCMACGPVAKKFVEANLWISNGETRSIIHKDSNNQMVSFPLSRFLGAPALLLTPPPLPYPYTQNCLYNGTKQWLLFDPQYIRGIPMVRESEEDDPNWATSGFTKIKAHDVDLQTYPKFEKVPFQRALLNAGDCIYVPGGYLHQVYSVGERNIQVSMLFSGPHIGTAVPRAATGGAAAIAREVAKRATYADFGTKLRRHLVVPCPADGAGAGDGAGVKPVHIKDADVAWDYVGSGYMTMGFMNTNHFQEQVEGQMWPQGHDDESAPVSRSAFLQGYKIMLVNMLKKTDSPTIMLDDLSMTLDALSMLFPQRASAESWGIQVRGGTFILPNARVPMLEESMARATAFFDGVADPEGSGKLTLGAYRRLRSNTIAKGLIGNFVVDQVTSNYAENNGDFGGEEGEEGEDNNEGAEDHGGGGGEDEDEERREDGDEEEDSANAKDEL